MSNPYLLPEPSIVSFSGGRTSGYMLRQILDAFGGRLPEWVKVVFCNTGKERPETLGFVERVSLEWDVPIIWLEYRRWESDPGPACNRWSCRSRNQARPWAGLEVVNYATASRNGEPFEMVIASKSLLPNVAIRYCTQKLKIQVSSWYVRHMLGWRDYTNAIGLRADEMKRVAKLRPSPKTTPGERRVAPLALAGACRDDVMEFWAEQPFDLQLKQHEGNCDLCFLKGQGKLLAILQERPELADWWAEQERKFVGKTRLEEAGRFSKDKPSYKAMQELARQPGLFDLRGAAMDCGVDDCRCTD